MASLVMMGSESWQEYIEDEDVLAGCGGGSSK